MNKVLRNLFVYIFIIILLQSQVLADDVSKGEQLIKKAKLAQIKDESYEYINKARDIFREAYENNPSDIRVLLGLSKVAQFIQDRGDAKLYLLMAYNTNPADPKLQREMADFFYNFQEYSTAIEYYKLALASGLLMDFETNLKTAQCYEKLADVENARLYYQICAQINPSSKVVADKLNQYDSEDHPDNTEELENAGYKYLFKDKKLSEKEQNEADSESIIEQINSSY